VVKAGAIRRCKMYRSSAHAFDALGAMQTHALYYAPPYADRRLIFDGIRQGLRISAERPRLCEDGVSVDPTDPDLAVQTTSPGEFYKIHTRGVSSPSGECDFGGKEVTI
jgi:hypothetical protein